MIALWSKPYAFCGAHKLDFLPADHKCSRLHGHTWKVRVKVGGAPDENGMMIDYAELTRIWLSIHAVIDHRFLNELPGLDKPTTETIAKWIAHRFREQLPGGVPLLKVRVKEGVGGEAVWTPDLD